MINDSWNDEDRKKYGWYKPIEPDKKDWSLFQTISIAILSLYVTLSVVFFVWLFTKTNVWQVIVRDLL